MKRKKIAVSALVAATCGAGVWIATPASADDPVEIPEDQLLKICNTGSNDDGWTGDCTFEAASETPEELEWHRYGQPVTNCAPGATQNIVLTVGDVRSFTETWTKGGGISLDITDFLKIEGKAEYQKSKTVTNETRNQITAPPGRKNAVTLGTAFVVQTGRMRADVNVPVSAPDGNVSYYKVAYYIDDVSRRVVTGRTEAGQDEVACGEKFRVDPEP